MPWAGVIRARGGRYYPRLDAYAALWMLAKLPMLIAVRGIQPRKSDPVEPPCGRCSGVGVRLQVSDPYEILQPTVEIRRGSVHAEALGRCHRVHAAACRGVPQLPSHRLQQLHGLGAHVTSRTSYATLASVHPPETLPFSAPCQRTSQTIVFSEQGDELLNLNHFHLIDFYRMRERCGWRVENNHLSPLLSGVSLKHIGELVGQQ